MFKRMGRVITEVDEGFLVRILERTGIAYSEGNRTVHVESDILFSGPFRYVVYEDSIKKWDFPHSNESIVEETRKRIINNIRRAFAWQGLAIAVKPFKNSQPSLTRWSAGVRL